jgi:hypothetical protein
MDTIIFTLEMIMETMGMAAPIPAILVPTIAIPPTPHCPFNGGPSFNSDSASGECIAERVGGNELGFGGYDVAEFNPPGHQEQVTNCDINNVAIGSQAHNYMVLENGGAQLLIDVGPISNGTDFPFRWHQSS